MTLGQYWTQILELTLASVKSRYRKTFAGFLWVFLNPVLQFGVQCLVFKEFLKLNIPNYYLFLLGGLLPWIFITQTISMGVPVFTSNAHLLRSFKVSPLVILCSNILDNFLNFTASVILILTPIYLFSDQSLVNLVGIPLAIMPLLILTSSITLMLATLNVFYRDVNFVIGFILNLFFFLTPVFYPRSMVPEKFRWIIDLNPFLYVIEPFRWLFLSPQWGEFFIWLAKSWAVAICFLLTSLFIWKRRRNEFYFRL